MADYEIIAEGSVDGSAPSAITLSGIPGSYTHLELTFNGASTRSSGSYHDYTWMRLNGDTGAQKYCRAQTYKLDASGASSTFSSIRQGFGPTGAQDRMWTPAYLPTRWVGQSTQLMAYARHYFPNYSGTTLTKSMICFGMLAGAYNWPGSDGSKTGIATWNGVWGWNDTSAITELSINSNEAGFGFAVNTSYILAGIK